jgi:hypothetical protein
VFFEAVNMLIVNFVVYLLKEEIKLEITFITPLVNSSPQPPNQLYIPILVLILNIHQ